MPEAKFVRHTQRQKVTDLQQIFSQVCLSDDVRTCCVVSVQALTTTVHNGTLANSAQPMLCQSNGLKNSTQ